MFIFADKTNKIFEMKPQGHKKLIMENITKTYQEAPDKLEKSINMKAKNIAKSYKLAERIDHLPRSEMFITLKDHKDNFYNKPSCRLINPTKNELGKISKKIIKQINREILKKTDANQWKNANNVINWFNNIKNKIDCTFIQFDIKDFYPSITEEILEEAISFTKSLIDTDDHKIRTIEHCRKSLSFYNNVAWKKKTTASCFDVTMGSYDGAEICELVGTFMLSKLGNIIRKKNTGLNRDDRLAVLRKMNARGTDKMRKIIIKLFKEVGFQLEIKSNLKKVEFLDVTLNLITVLYTPYKKSNDTLLYINTSSDHPPQIIKQLTNSINKRLCENSVNEQVFKTVKPVYEKALHKSRYKKQP